MRYGEIIAVCSDILSKHIGWYVEFFNVKPGGAGSKQRRVLVWEIAEFTRVVPQVMSNFFLHANWEQ